MIEPIMFLGLGFLAASLLALVIMPLVHNRAVRLTTRRLASSMPLSLAEIQADKDQLRAEFAVLTRRLEVDLEQLKAKAVSQVAELSKKSDAINQLKIELGEKTATIVALEARERALRDELRATEEDLGVKITALQEAERSLADRQAELSKITAEFDEQSVNFASQRIEVVALKTQVSALTDQIADLQKQVHETGERLEQERKDAEATIRALEAERAKTTSLGSRISELERLLAGQTSEAEALSQRVSELETRLSEQADALAEVERERDKSRVELMTTRRVESELRGELTSIDQRHEAVTAALSASKALAENQLERAREERTKLQREIAAMKREAETTWTSERVESALLRERINAVAAEVVRLTATLEGPNSPINSILTENKAPGFAPTINGGGSADKRETKPSSETVKGSLADRIRSLQAHASRLSSTS